MLRFRFEVENGSLERMKRKLNSQREPWEPEPVCCGNP